MAVTVAQATLTVVRDDSALQLAKAVSNRDVRFDQDVRSMQTSFYAYDDEMALYALLDANAKERALAASDYGRALSYRRQFNDDLALAAVVAPSSHVLTIFSDVKRNLTSYNADAAIVRHDIQGHHYAAASYEQAVSSRMFASAIEPLVGQAVSVGNTELAMHLHQIRNDQRAAITWAWIETVLILGILVLALIVIQRYAVRPLVQLTGIAQHLAQGDVRDELTVHSSDELGDLATAFRRISAYLMEAGSVARAIGQGDLTVAYACKSENDVLGQALLDMHGRLRDLIEELQVAARSVQSSVEELVGVVGQTTDATQQIATAIGQTAQATGESSQGLQQIALAMQQLKVAVDQVADGTSLQAGQAQSGEAALDQMKAAQTLLHEATVRMEELASGSRQTAQEGHSQVEETLLAMGRIADVTRATAQAIGLLGQHSQRIGAIAGTISDIAAQTNLLALNANIEAARAGEHGRGFAVVADEVRKLAEQSSREATNVSELIRTIQETVQQSVQSMERGEQEVVTGQALGEKTRTVLHDMEIAASQVAAEMGMLSETVQKLEQQSAGVDRGIREIARIAQENAAAAHQMSASSLSITDTVEGLAAISEQTAAATEEVATTGEHVAESTQTLSDKAQILSQVAHRLNERIAQYRLE